MKSLFFFLIIVSSDRCSVRRFSSFCISTISHSGWNSWTWMNMNILTILSAASECDFLTLFFFPSSFFPWLVNVAVQQKNLVSQTNLLGWTLINSWNFANPDIKTIQRTKQKEHFSIKEIAQLSILQSCLSLFCCLLCMKNVNFHFEYFNLWAVFRSHSSLAKWQQRHGLWREGHFYCRYNNINNISQLWDMNEKPGIWDGICSTITQLLITRPCKKRKSSTEPHSYVLSPKMHIILVILHPDKMNSCVLGVPLCQLYLHFNILSKRVRKPIVLGGIGDASVSVPFLTDVQMACWLCTSKYPQCYDTLQKREKNVFL